MIENEATTNLFRKKNEGRVRAELRKLNAKKARRKEAIVRKVYNMDPLNNEDGDHYYDNLHQFSKNKIHCSCPSCSGMTKTNSKKVNKGGAKPQTRNFSSFGTTNHRHGKNYKPSELRKLEAMAITD